MIARGLVATILAVPLVAAVVAVAAPGAHRDAVRAGAAAAKAKPKGLRAPALQSPRDEASLGYVPAFTWARVKGADLYEFQLSADGAFRSIVLGQRSGSFRTKNTAATINQTLQDGNYFWRVRAINAKGDAGPWSRTRTLRKVWDDAPQLKAPAAGATIDYPNPLVLSWSSVPRAFKYSVEVATDPALSSPADGFKKPVETSGTDGAVSFALAPGTYYWAVTALDARGHKGTRSSVGTFNIAWPSTTATRIDDLNADPRVYDPQVSWDAVPGAARYEVEINSSDDFAPGSKVCCTDRTTGLSISPTKVLPNNTGLGGGYFWRVRAIDVDGNAGVWNRGPNFPKYFSPTDIESVPNLHLKDHIADVAQVGVPRLGYPVVAWDPAPGASSYEIQVASVTPLTTTFVSAAGTTIVVGSTAHMVPGTTISFANGDERSITSIVSSTQLTVDSPLSSTPAGGSSVQTSSGPCNWTATLWDVETASTAWTPLGPSAPTPVGLGGPAVSSDLAHLSAGRSYCVRIRARGDRDLHGDEVVSAWTELGDFLDWTPTFEYAPPPPQSCTTPPQMQASDYLTPAYGEVSTRMPFFAWDPVPGACSYYVVVATDASFTDVVDLAITRDPDYAPRVRSRPRTYPDETSSYFWAVLPAAASDGGGVASKPEDNAPREFHKRSRPPVLLGPIGGEAVARQPTFHWSSAEGARDYRLQVAQDPSFSDPLDDVRTDATAYTTASTYPADTALYWRVRADDENGIGLTWSEPATFSRRLPTPIPSSDNPTGGRTIPLLTWSPVEGAVSYDIHVDQPDGTQKDFNVRSAAFTPTAHYGTGVWQWKVRANFPKTSTGTTPGGYSVRQSFTRFIGSPAGARGIASSTRMLLSWDPAEMAKSYRVEISTNNSFTTRVESITTDNTSYAPKLTSRGYADGGTLYWRVASIDEGGNVGGYTTGTFSLPKRIKVVVKGALRHRVRTSVSVKVTDARGRSIRKAKVRVSGGGIRIQAKRTTKRGTIVFRLRPGRRGNVTFVASKGGYRSGSATVKVG
jgi:hypothetical protein